jgi:hypothetical protein
VAAHLGPLVVLFGQDRAGHADQGIAAGEDPTTSVRRDLPVDLFLRHDVMPISAARED